MTKQKMLDLPKVYENEGGNYPQHVGKPKLSYSAYTSFCEESYKGEFFANYFLGIRSEGNIFTEYGSKCGEYLEKLEKSDLSEFDISVLEKIERPENARYEVEVVIDRGSYVIQGFIDQEFKVPDGLVIKDLKTGAIDKKYKDYAGEDYQQTTLYAYQRELEGENVVYSGVMLLDRKGNGQEKYPLRLTGEIADIPTPYSIERAEAFLKKFDKVALQIEEYHKVYKKYFA
jgi:hypothetical protein